MPKRTGPVDPHLTRIAQTERLRRELKRRGEYLDGTESEAYLMRCAQLHDFDGSSYLDKHKIIRWW